MSAPSPLVDDALCDKCLNCGREIVTARLDGGRRVALDYPELDHPEGDVEPTCGVVLLDAAGQAHSHREQWGSDARHTLHHCGQGAGQRGGEAT